MRDRAGQRLVMAILKVVKLQPVDMEAIQIGHPRLRIGALVGAKVRQVTVPREDLPIRRDINGGAPLVQDLSSGAGQLDVNEVTLEGPIRRGAGKNLRAG